MSLEEMLSIIENAEIKCRILDEAQKVLDASNTQLFVAQQTQYKYECLALVAPHLIKSDDVQRQFDLVKMNVKRAARIIDRLYPICRLIGDGPEIFEAIAILRQAVDKQLSKAIKDL